MSTLQARCPSCGGNVQFTSGSTVVVVCPYCRSAVARTDRGVEDLGKVAEIAESESPLKLNLKGTYKGNNFELTGRAQLGHEMGGFWDEWYATFSNGWVAWLAEAQGKFYITFYQPLPNDVVLPPFDQLQIGQNVPQIPSATLIVTEKGTATSIAAEGEIPYKLTPQEKSDYADLSGQNNSFATIDYSMRPPWVFVGERVELSDIGLATARPAKRAERSVGSAAIGCPNCGGPLSLNAPDKTERVTCPNCNSLLDVNRGNLKFLRALRPPEHAPNFALEIGLEGVLPDGSSYKIIGAVVRSVTIEGIKYLWHEYLLYNPMVGFRWLVHSDNHWNWVEPIEPAEVGDSSSLNTGASPKYKGKTFKIFQDASAVVEYVKGEFYWRVEQGETVRAIDYVKAPLMLSQESSSKEMNWSVGTYMPNAQVEKIFGVSGLAKPWSVAPNQPFTGSFYYTWGFLPLLALIVVSIFMIPLGGFGGTPLSQEIALPPLVNATTPQILYSQPFELKQNRNVRISASANVNNSWADINVDLINDQSQEVESVNIPIEYYTGSDSDGAWSEGGQSQDATLSSLPGGKYTLRVEGTWEKYSQPMTVSVKVEQNVSRGVNFTCALLLLLIFPVIMLIRKMLFESRRWSESMFSTAGGEDDSD